MVKYKEFYDCHEKWNVGVFTFGYFFKKNILMKKSMPIMISGIIDRIFALKELYPSHAELYNGKILFNFNRMAGGSMDDAYVLAN